MPRSRPAISKQRWARIRLLALDVDGILTDGRIGISTDGSEMKFFSVLDGGGLKRALAAGIEVAWISGRPSRATSRRAAELKVRRVIQGRDDKLAALCALAGKLGLAPAQCLYMGDDDIDAPALAWAGIGVSVPGAMPAALAAADWVTARKGGRGAVREICELILAAKVQPS